MKREFAQRVRALHARASAVALNVLELDMNMTGLALPPQNWHQMLESVRASNFFQIRALTSS
jgi:hypothetical protein